MQQFEIELNRCAAMIKAADDAYAKHDYATSENLYHACLASLDEIYAGDSVTIADCLTGLGDSYYFQDKFGSALPMYERLLVMRERLPDSSPASLIKAHFKLAKTHEKLKNNAEAAEHYKRGREITNQKLVTGHPLGTTLLESYAKYLRKIEPDSPAYREVEEKARKNREVYLDPVRLNIKILEGLAEVRDGQLVLAEEVAKLEKIRQKQLSGKMGVFVSCITWLKAHRRIAIAVLTLPMTVSLLVVLGVGSYYIFGGEAAQQQLVHAGETYRSEDGHIDVSVQPEHNLKLRFNQSEVSKHFSTVSNAWRALYMVYLHPHYGMYWIQKVDDKVVDQNGLTASLGQPGADPLFPTMLEVAAQIHSEWSEKELDKGPPPLVFQNPYNGKSEKLEVHVISYRLDSAPGPRETESLRKDLENVRVKSDLGSLHSVTFNYNSLSNSPIVCLVVRQEKVPDALILLGFNKSGRALQTCVDNKTLFLESGNGVPFRSNCKLADIAPASSATASDPYGSIIISSTSPERVKSLCFAVIVDLALMPFVILFGIILREQISKWFDQKYVSKAEHGAHMLALIYVWFLMIYLSFTFLTLCSMLAGFF